MHLKPTHDEKNQLWLGSWEYLFKILILVSMVTFAWETDPDLSPGMQIFLKWCELIIVSIFTFEYLVRLTFTKPPLRYVLSFHGVVDLLSILPFFLGLAMDLRSLRAIRLLRLFRLFKLARYSAALRRMHTALITIREELVIFGATAMITLYLSAVGIYYCENDAQPEKFRSIMDSLWWAICTLTTVGYGDIYPITVAGRFFTFVVLIVGIGIVAVPTSLLSSALTKAREEEKAQRKSASQHPRLIAFHLRMLFG